MSDPFIAGILGLIGVAVGAVVGLTGKMLVDRRQVDTSAYEKLFGNFQTEIGRLQVSIETREAKFAECELMYAGLKTSHQKCERDLALLLLRVEVLERQANGK